jgi:hypothetical protein
VRIGEEEDDPDKADNHELKRPSDFENQGYDVCQAKCFLMYQGDLTTFSNLLKSISVQTSKKYIQTAVYPI